MSILNVNKINPVGGGSTITIAGIASVTNAVSVGNSVTAGSFVGPIEGAVTGNVTGNADTASGLSGNPSINTTGIVTATSFVPTEGQLSHRNIVVNGDMRIAQRGASFTGVTASGTFPVDRFLFHVGSLGTWTLTQSTDVPAGQGFANSIKCDVTTANASPSGTAYARIDQRFEGQDLQRFCKGTSNAKQFAVSFWVKSPKTGTHIVQFQDQDNSRNVSKAYTVSSANTWEKKELIFPADTTGAFGNDNGGSLFLCFYLAVGTGYQGGTLQTTWGTPSNNTRATGQVNVADSTSNDFYLTGVQLEVGAVSTPFEHRSIGEELSRCQRYFFNITGNTGSRSGIPGYANSTTSLRAMVQFPAPMRAIPSISGSSTAMILDSHDDSASFNCSSLTAGGAPTTSNPTQMCIEVGTSGMTNGQGGQLEFRAANGFINFSAEL